MTRGSDARSPAQNHLAGHELAVVFAERAWKRLVSRITGVGAGRPFPAIAEQLLNPCTSRCSRMESSSLEQVSLDPCLARNVFPFRLSRKPATSPTRKRISLEATDVAHGRIKQGRKPCQPVSVNTRQPVLSQHHAASREAPARPRASRYPSLQKARVQGARMRHPK